MLGCVESVMLLVFISFSMVGKEDGAGERRGWLWVTEKETASRAIKQTGHKDPGFRLPQCSWSCLGASPQTWSSARPDFLISFRCSTASTLVSFCRLSNPSFNRGNNLICVSEPIMNILLMCRVHPALKTGFP